MTLREVLTERSWRHLVEFVDFTLGHAQELAGDVGLVAASDDTIKTSKDAWATFADKDAAASA